MEIGARVETLGGGLNAVHGDRGVVGWFEVGVLFQGLEMISPITEECQRYVGGVLVVTPISSVPLPLSNCLGENSDASHNRPVKDYADWWSKRPGLPLFGNISLNPSSRNWGCQVPEAHSLCSSDLQCSCRGLLEHVQSQTSQS
jgi:hypothetical protein